MSYQSPLLYGQNPSGTPIPILVDASGKLLWSGFTPSSPGVVQIADKTTPTQLLAVDTSGRITLVPNQTMKIVDTGGTNQLGIDVNGAATITDLIRYMTAQGKAYGAVKSGTTGAAQNVGVALFTPQANAKNVLLYRIRCSSPSGAQFNLNQQTTNYALSSSLTPYNKNPSSGNTSGCTVTGTLNAGAVAGTNWDNALLSGTPFEILQNNAYIYLPAGTAQSIIAYVAQAASGFASVLFEWLEF